MKRLLPILLLTLSACASPPAPNSAVEQAAYEAIGKCYDSQAAIEQARLTKLSDPKDVLLSQSIDALKETAGKKNPCESIKTNADLQAIAMQENTKRSGMWLDFGKSGLSTAGTTVLGLKGLDVLGDALSQRGNHYNLTSEGDMSLSDSLKTSSFEKTGDIGIRDFFSDPTTETTITFPAE